MCITAPSLLSGSERGLNEEVIMAIPHPTNTNQNAATAEVFVDTVRSLVRPFLAVSLRMQPFA